MTRIAQPIAASGREVPPLKKPRARTLASSPEAKLTSAKRIHQVLQRLASYNEGRLPDDVHTEVAAAITAIPASDRPPILFAELSRAIAEPLLKTQERFRVKSTSGPSLETLLPRSGWFADYLNWTLQTEPPFAFHFFSAATVIGSTLSRRVFFDKGAYTVFPNLCTILVAPTGRCRKTTAANLAIGLLTQTGGHLLADKTTPESMVDSLRGNANALIYAPELAVFLGKQKYQEGMVPLLTALLDSPKEWTVKTLGRGETTLTNVCLGALMCSTLDWLQSAVPNDVFGGGFMSRFIFIVQDYTDRVYALPPPLSKELRMSLLKKLGMLRRLRGQALFTPEARDWYDAWYRARQRQRPEGGYLAGYFERKPDHMLRLAMILEVCKDNFVVNDDKTFFLDIDSVQQAEALLTWLEFGLPETFERATTSIFGDDCNRVINHLRSNHGCLDHSTLLRKNSSRISSEQFRRTIDTLKEAMIVEVDHQARRYYLTPTGWRGATKS